MESPFLSSEISHQNVTQNENPVWTAICGISGTFWRCANAILMHGKFMPNVRGKTRLENEFQKIFSSPFAVHERAQQVKPIETSLKLFLLCEHSHLFGVNLKLRADRSRKSLNVEKRKETSRDRDPKSWTMMRWRRHLGDVPQTISELGDVMLVTTAVAASDSANGLKYLGGPACDLRAVDGGLIF